jgi:hypothetical protein
LISLHALLDSKRRSAHAWAVVTTGHQLLTSVRARVDML